MKPTNLISASAIALMVAIPFAVVTPSIASLQSREYAIAQNAQQQGSVQLKLAAERQSIIAAASGQMEWKPMPTNAALVPGETIRYVVTASNTSDRPIKNLVINQPIPQNSVYVLGSATIPNIDGAKLIFSIDGGRSYTEKPTIKKKNENGEIVAVPAPDNLYTHIRWNFGETFPPQTVNATYQVRIR